jgi:hypothetical protein
MQTQRSFAAGATFGAAATVIVGAALMAAGSHAPAGAAETPTLPNAAAQRNETLAELKAIREAIDKQTALLDARLPAAK